MSIKLLFSRETQYTGPGHGIDAHVADRARLHARVYNCTTQLQRVLDIESFDVVPTVHSEFFSQILFDFIRMVSHSISPKFSGKIPYVLSKPQICFLGSKDKTVLC